MKRFFKKASLVLVAICLIVGNVLPTFAENIKSVEGVCTYMENRDLDCGDGSTVYTYKYCCFTGTYDDDTVGDIATYFAIHADCRSGYLDSHSTEFVVGAESANFDEGDPDYYYAYVEQTTRQKNARYFEYTLSESGSVPRQYLEGFCWMEFTATAGGTDWDDIYQCDWTPNRIGWVEY